MAIAISIDPKKSRIRIHKETLEEIDHPHYIHILVNPGKLRLAIKASGRKTKDSLHVIYNSEKDCEFYSSELVEQLLVLANIANRNCTYRINGFKVSHCDTAVFPIENISLVNSEETHNTN